MTTAEFAKMLDGRSYGREITLAESKKAKDLGFVIVFGSSDDNAELEGAICDEIGCYNGGELKHDDLPKPITAIWDPEGKDCSWAYETELPHDEFRIYNDGELYCIGIVCDINNKQDSAPVTNASRVTETLRAIAEYGVRGMFFNDHAFAWYGHFQGFANFKEEAIQKELEWLQQPVEGNT